ncbi:hypothetical protein [Micromonospora wenchangensis]|uniref:hypothetical protein n=1 Tax=Micromonospora wenchangensis TaxID=1185415 RepID=UPI003830ECE7
MTTSITARPTTGAGPAPKDHSVTDNRTYERLLNSIKIGTIRLDPTDYRYRNTVNGADVDDATYAAADKGYIHLLPGQNPTITEAGEQWLAGRYTTLGPSPTRPLFLAPGQPSAGYEKRRGERINTARLTEQQVRDIKARMFNGASNAVLAREFGVDESTIRRIRTGTNWRHVA